MDTEWIVSAGNDVGEKLNVIRKMANENVSDLELEPVLLIAVSIAAWIVVSTVWKAIRSAFTVISDQGLTTSVIKLAFVIVKLIPGAHDYIKKEQNKVIEKLQKGMKSQRDCWRTELPVAGLGTDVIKHIKTLKSVDKSWKGKCSGAVYIGGGEMDGHFAIINEAYSLFAHTNPLHPDTFPSVVRFEVEVVAMTAALFGSKHSASGGQVCGNMTSGGTESIVMAVKTSRDFMKETRGIVKPEMIIGVSAHSAYEKAAQYLQIKVRHAPVNKDLKLDVKAVKRLVNRNTIMIVGSAPGFPHGVIDPIEELGALALRNQICLHVDLCLGGFVLPFARKLGYPLPGFDFTVPGVTSMSADVHKYGLGPKGTSVVLYRNHDIRKHQFVAVTDWSGGLYISPTMAGSRSGGLIAGAWAALMAVGEEGFLSATKKLMDTSLKLQKGIERIPGLHVLGKPDMTVVAFGSNELDIYKVNDVMTSRGWTLNSLQRPASLHFCITLQHVDSMDSFLDALADAVKTVRENPSQFEDGMAPIYGAAEKMPDRGTIGEILVAYMDSAC